MALSGALALGAICLAPEALGLRQDKSQFAKPSGYEPAQGGTKAVQARRLFVPASQRAVARMVARSPVIVWNQLACAQRAHHTKPDPKSMRVMPLCLWGV